MNSGDRRRWPGGRRTRPWPTRWGGLMCRSRAMVDSAGRHDGRNHDAHEARWRTAHTSPSIHLRLAGQSKGFSASWGWLKATRKASVSLGVLVAGDGVGSMASSSSAGSGCHHGRVGGGLGELPWLSSTVRTNKFKELGGEEVPKKT